MNRPASAWSRYLDSLPIAELYAQWRAGKLWIPAKGANNATAADFDQWAADKFHMSTEDALMCRGREPVSA